MREKYQQAIHQSQVSYQSDNKANENERFIQLLKPINVVHKKTSTSREVDEMMNSVYEDMVKTYLYSLKHGRQVTS